jgi:hypothetical protein
MILSDNLLILRNRFPVVLDKLKKLEEQLRQQPIEVVPAKNGIMNLSVERDGQTYYVHSKYDPQNEAEKFIAQFELQPSHHVFFYGLGLGYHIRAMQEKLGETPFSIYEPNPAILYHFLCTYSLRDYAFKNLRHIYLGASEGEMVQQLAHFVEQVKDPVLIVSLPSYGVMMKQDTERFEEQFRKKIVDKRSALHTNVGYEKLWIVNSGNNFKTVSETPSVLRQKKQFFQGKPALLVSAGPSLDGEIDNVKRIKEAGLAYIFAVGSANKALINHGIYPDAVMAYDPTAHNHIVYDEIITQGIDSIPLIFGSSGSYNTVRMYPGPKLHMITGQDPISEFLFGKEQLQKNNEIISDAPSIAVLTLELLAKLDCSHIILVGQNFGFLNNQYYADGIRYEGQSSELKDRDQAGIIEVEGVEGELVLTIDAHLRAKSQMEGLLTLVPRHIEVINTTAGGAKIEGTKFMRLTEVMENKLSECVVNPEWYVNDGEFSYDMSHVRKQAAVLKQEYELFIETGNELLSVMRKLDNYASNHNNQQINRTLPRFDKLFKRWLNNKYAAVLVLPLIRVQFEILQKSAPSVFFETNLVNKVKLLISIYGKFISVCQDTHMSIGVQLYQQVHHNVDRLNKHTTTNNEK